MKNYTRLTYNSNNWESPSRPNGKCLGNPAESLWEGRTGFGFEEWYRSDLFKREENGIWWQYGYWQCFKKPKKQACNVYNDFSVYTRVCAPNNKTKANILVANYKNVEVLTKEQRLEACQYFDNSFKTIRTLLEQITTHEGQKVDIVNDFDKGLGIYSKLNIKYRLEDETYRFDTSQPFKLQRGGYRFGLYEPNKQK